MAATLSIIPAGLLSKVLSLAAEEISRVWGLKQDLQNVAERLEMIEALLSDAERKHFGSKVVQLWLEKLEAVASEADDVLGDYAYEVLRRQIEVPQRKRDKVRLIFSPLQKLAFRYEMAQKLKNVNLHLEKIYKEANNIGLRIIDITSEGAQFDNSRLTGPSIVESEIIGRDDDVSEVVNMLVNEENEKDISVLGIVGMPGQGKTTLAQLVYKNDRVIKNFTKRIWVCVSKDFTIERLLNEIAQSLTKTNPQMTNREAIVKKLQEEINKEKYLLVLDDVWNEDQEKWECMRNCLLGIGGSRGSKILVTTRNEIVALTIQASLIYHLGVLSEHDSWTLFKLRAFADGGAIETQELVEIGQRIVKKCGGVPLAIKTLGGLMYYKRDERQWLAIENSDIWSSSNNVDVVMSSIKLTFNHLPSSSLKQCFAYCCIFPKDYVMEKESLIHLWMAQGFLNPPKGSHLKMEDIGNNYFNILLHNSLLQEPAYDEYDNIRSCKMHDLVHDFALDASKNSCISVVVGRVTDTSKAVHLSMKSIKGEMVNMIDGVSPKLRTLYIKGVVDGDFLTQFKYLQVLILDDFAIKELSTSIGTLKHLKCIDILWTKVCRLPASIIKLYNLQTLRIAIWTELPKKLETLTNLRHLYVKGFFRSLDFGMLAGIGKLVHLRTLSYFIVGHENGCQIQELGPLENLEGKLKLLRLENVKNGEEARKANLWKKVNIDRLMFEWGDARKKFNDEDVLEGLEPHKYLKGLAIINFKGSKFPTWMVSPSNSLLLHNLVKIRLENCDLCEKIPSLGHLRHLRILEIIKLHNVKRIGTDFYGLTYLDSTSNIGAATCVFPSLRTFYLLNMDNLLEWMSIPSANIIAFPSLEELNVNACKNLIRLPSMNGLTRLEELVITECNSLASLPDMDDLESLQTLTITDCHSLVYIPDLPEGLRLLEIRRCKELDELPEGIQVCTALEGVIISDCPLSSLDNLEFVTSLRRLGVGDFYEELDHFPFPWPITNDYFVSLESLGLYGWPILTSLPEQIQYLPSLRTLKIWDFGDLEALPEWLGKIQSLEILELCFCDNLKYLPSAEAMQQLTDLLELKIEDCLLLEERCTRGSGPEWHKIAHIPNIVIEHLVPPFDSP